MINVLDRYPSDMGSILSQAFCVIAPFIRHGKSGTGVLTNESISIRRRISLQLPDTCLPRITSAET